MILFLAGLTALAFVVVTMRQRKITRPLRGLLLLVAAAIAVYVGWLFLSAALK